MGWTRIKDEDHEPEVPQTGLPIVLQRPMWGAHDPYDLLPRLDHPVSFVMVAFTQKDYMSPRGKLSPGANPKPIACAEEVRYVQLGDIKRNAGDIRYNFMVCPDGMIYEGRGWERRPFLPARYRQLQDKTLFIGYIGDFSKEEPPRNLFGMKDYIIKTGVERSYISPQFTLIEMNNPFTRVPKVRPFSNLKSCIYYMHNY